MSHRNVALGLGAALAALALACGDDRPAPAAADPQAAKAKASRKAKDEEKPDEPERAPLASMPVDFVEASRWRDPFMSYATEFALEARKRVKSQREVVLDRLMALESDDIDVDQVKWVVLMVMFNQPGEETPQPWMEDLFFEERSGEFH